ncbi:MAG TPA: SDR family NAD(P)-dependent oxidoreductase [Victivallales bacterium]|nr:SDR family NAD(P)-dependent oxidoreductase [Victivallales bacterium]
MSKQHIFITGASQGIGRALAVRLSEENVILTLIARNKNKLIEVSKRCSDKGAIVNIHSADICDYTKLQEFILESDEKQNIDLMILAAGITSTVNDSKFEEWNLAKNVLETNLISQIAGANVILPVMQKRREGHIVFLSSLTVYSPMAYTPAYCASKSGIKAYAESVRQYFKNDNVHISITLPGFVKTNMSDQFYRPKPFMITAEKAAEIIAKGIDKKKAYISFPFLLDMWLKLQVLFPYKITDLITKISGYGRK